MCVCVSEIMYVIIICVDCMYRQGYVNYNTHGTLPR